SGTIDGDCSNEGQDVFECSQCGDVRYEGNGEYGECDYSRVSDHQPATCEDWGYTIWRCSVCGGEDQSDYPPTGHDYEYWLVEGADCQTYGTDCYECINCGDYYEEESIETGPHDFDPDGYCYNCGIAEWEFAPSGSSGIGNDSQIIIQKGFTIFNRKEYAIIEEDDDAYEIQ
ncbi:MAG: hypothetical protein IJB98_03090, partial [Clostridia bacterium]|nr:hypothetical protein [Clostridia bacterium]